jgi:hypothetical protein
MDGVDAIEVDVEVSRSPPTSSGTGATCVCEADANAVESALMTKKTLQLGAEQDLTFCIGIRKTVCGPRVDLKSLRWRKAEIQSAILMRQGQLLFHALRTTSQAMCLPPPISDL